MGLRQKENKKQTAETALPQHGSASYQAPKHYQDGEIELDAIERLKSNILMLDDLQQRLGFMNNELEQILGSKKRS
mgnify:CR=1 FL=1